MDKNFLRKNYFRSLGEPYYKYTDFEGINYILKDKTLKFGELLEYNDPFENRMCSVPKVAQQSLTIVIYSCSDMENVYKNLELYREYLSAHDEYFANQNIF